MDVGFVDVAGNLDKYSSVRQELAVAQEEAKSASTAKKTGNTQNAPSENSKTGTTQADNQSKGYTEAHVDQDTFVQKQYTKYDLRAIKLVVEEFEKRKEQHKGIKDKIDSYKDTDKFKYAICITAYILCWIIAVLMIFAGFALVPKFGLVSRSNFMVFMILLIGACLLFASKYLGII